MHVRTAESCSELTEGASEIKISSAGPEGTIIVELLSGTVDELLRYLYQTTADAIRRNKCWEHFLTYACIRKQKLCSSSVSIFQIILS